MQSSSKSQSKTTLVASSVDTIKMFENWKQDSLGCLNFRWDSKNFIYKLFTKNVILINKQIVIEKLGSPNAIRKYEVKTISNSKEISKPIKIVELEYIIEQNCIYGFPTTKDNNSLRFLFTEDGINYELLFHQY
ncbi:MAG: hypothetical protein IPP29_11330 [Bacteroidetes bacterium]|nr:hypothetical protein [Bacteroidota bacterium]